MVITPLNIYTFDYSTVYADYNVPPQRAYSGSFEFDGKMNQLLNSDDWTLEACNGITITGNQEFVADGTHELILENIQNDCINNSYNSKCSTFDNMSRKLDNQTVLVDSLNNFSCFPNPCIKDIFISMNIAKEGVFQIGLFTVSGIKIDEIFHNYLDNGKYSFSYDVSPLKSGVYFIKIKGPKTVNTIKIVKLTN